MTSTGWILSALLATSTSDKQQPQPAVISGLYRHAVKGLSGDSLESVHLVHAHDTFPDDRRFALLYEKNSPQWQAMKASSKEWLHKEYFLCAFTNPELMARFEASYQLLPSAPTETYGIPCDTAASSAYGTARRMLSLRDRTRHELVWGPEDLATEEGRSGLGDIFSRQSGLAVQCVAGDIHTKPQRHQFGNTSSGWKQRQDTRTVHLINANTVRQVADHCQISTLNPTRFRPNIVVEGWEPWSEFQWIGKTLLIQSTKTEGIGRPIRVSILSKTVRCDGVSVDPLDPGVVLDVPKLLTQHFPEHGPYLGVYATIEDPGVLSIGDQVALSLDD